MVKLKKDNDDDKRPIIIIRRPRKSERGGHGQSWKVAYADFVTSMMAFFLLLWLLSITNVDQKIKIADYFTPTAERISRSTNGANSILGGMVITSEGSKTDNVGQDQIPSSNEEDDLKNQKTDAALDRQDEKSFITAAESIRQAINDIPELKELLKNVIIDMTPEGLRIQIVDQEGRPMFPLGGTAPLPQTVKLLEIITKVIKDLPNKISIRGHTDSKQYGKDAAYTNWELSADRSNASRRVMLGAGFDTAKIENVQGKADREPLLPAEPDSARNRRISIILLKQSLVAGAKRSEERYKNKKPGAPAPEPKKHEEGVIYFP